MIVGRRKKDASSSQIRERSQKSIDFALDKIKQSEIAPFVRKLYLYGSCARGEQEYNSDVDLLLELDSSFDEKRYREKIIILKGSVTPPDLNMPEVDLKIVIGDTWKNSPMLYYQNVKKEGINIWEEN